MTRLVRCDFCGNEIKTTTSRLFYHDRYDEQNNKWVNDQVMDVCDSCVAALKQKKL